MRETLNTILQTSQDFCVDPKTSTTTSLTNTKAFIKREINRTIQFTHKKLQKVFKIKSLPKTMSTVISQQYYSYPPGLNVIDTVTIDNDTTIPPLRVVQSQRDWDLMNSGPVVSGIPSHIFMRGRDFGLFPVPKAAYTLTLSGRFYPKAMFADDYAVGTVTVTQNSQTVTGLTTTFTASMVGRYFSETDSDGVAIGEFYKIGAYVSPTVLTLETVFEESSLSASTFLIGESPNLPEEIHEFIAYRVANVYYGTRRRDSKKAQEYLNYYYTGDWANTRRTGVIEGGVLGFMQDYAKNGSENSQLIDYNQPVRIDFLSEEWETVS